MTTATATRPLKVAVIGNPNTGKSTLFNALAGLHAHVGNYPGVTVEKKVGHFQHTGRTIELIDLPGTYSLSPRSLDEMVSVDVILGQHPQVGNVDAVLCIADASNLERHLFLVGQILDAGVPTILVLNMWDAAERRGLRIDVERLREKLGVPVIVTEAHRLKGIDEVRRALTSELAAPPQPRLFPDCFYKECEQLEVHLHQHGLENVPWYLRERMLLDAGGTVEGRYLKSGDAQLSDYLRSARERLTQQGFRVPAAEAERRYSWARQLLADIVIPPTATRESFTDRLDRWLTHRVFGLVIFAVLMFLVFQVIYAWAEPLMGMCETAQEWVGAHIQAAMPPGPLRSLLVDGVVAGVGGVLIFLPQIMLLFLLIAILEDCGYMARGAYMMDRVMSTFGLSGKSFLPLMSSFACAVPGIMATRVIDNRRDRMVTILVAPLMSCSARLPVYLLLIGAFIPATAYLWGRVSLPGLVLFAMSTLGLLAAIPVAWLLKKFCFPGEASSFILELPEYKWPSPRLVLYRMYDRGKAFVLRAGSLIFATTILVWAAAYFPGDHATFDQLSEQVNALAETLPADDGGEPIETAEFTQLADARNAEGARLIRSSFLGRAGEAIEPVVKPLGWDWRIGVGVIASFPAREVVIATLGTIYSLGGDVDEESEGLRGALQAAEWPDGRKVFNIPVALSLMVFFALCAQCASTLMIIRRETNSWGWAAFSFAYMTGLAYVAALVTYQVGMRW
ncbi:MAG: ferrous iron transport protein B [Planctomycetaceae bacterium]